MADKKSKDTAADMPQADGQQGQQETLKFGRVPVPEEKLKA